MDGERKILWGYSQPSLLKLICNNDGYRKHNQKPTRNKMVLVYIVILILKNSRQKTVGIQIEEGKYYWKIVNHHYLTQYVIMVDIKRRFRNIQEIKQYRFTLLEK